MTINLAEHDLEQRKLALDAGKSFIVQAPAGSGKTSLLINRLLTLLNHVKTPEEILAITFTKKAANEMRVRVINALKQGLYDPEPESTHAKQTWQLAKQVLKRDQQFNWNIINNPNQLRIQTIDSLCTYLTKQMPLLSHFGSQPAIAETPTVLYQEAVLEVLAHVEEDFAWSESIAKLLLHLDNDLNKLHDLLIKLLEKRDQWLPYIHLDNNTTEIKKQLENNLAAVITDNLQSIPLLFPVDLISELTTLARFAAHNLSLNKPDSKILACKDLMSLPGISPEHHPAWTGIATLLLTEKDTWRKQFNVGVGFPSPSEVKNPQEKILFAEFKQRALDLVLKLSDREDLRLALSKLSYLPKSTYQDYQWDILQALLQILKIAAAQLRVVFQQYGQIDFIENAQASIIALGNDELPTDLALALDYQIKHILVDEFQDTSFTQYHLLEKLTTGWEINDGRTLFIVGDPMQSIYRFREAEVGLFIRMREHGIGNIKLIPITLSINFRSSANIVEWNNEHFKGIFPIANDIATGAVNYNPSVSKNQYDPNANASITISGFMDEEFEDQANHIAEIIANSKKNNPDEKIAILVRARQHLKKIIPALKKAKIPYQAIEIDPLAEKQCIQDLFSLTSALLHPADRIAWLSVLRAPWCGLTLSDLLIIAGNDPFVSIYEQLEQPELLQNLSNDGKMRIEKVFAILKSKISERERYNTRYWVESTWLSLGGPACLHDSTEMDDANSFFNLLDDFEKSQESLNISKLKMCIEKLFAAPQSDESLLQVMTIHSAKGLEFDTVILPHLERKKATDDHPLLLWMEYPLLSDQIALLLAPIHATGNDKDSIYDFIFHQQQIKADFEINRLLYVATTRAKKHLHLLFNTYKKENGNYSIESGSFLHKLWPFFEKEAEKIISTKPNSENVISLNHFGSKRISRLSSDWINPVINLSTPIVSSHLKPGGFKLADTTAKLIGTVAHRILQQMSDNGMEWWTTKKPDEQARYLKFHLIQIGILPEHLEYSLNLTRRIIHNCLTDSRGLWILQSHQDAKAELAMTAVINGNIENLIIDRTFIDGESTRWIIDYKTSILEHANLEDFLEKEQEKYLDKMKLYAQAMQLMDDRPIRLGLYFPALPAWKEW